MKKILVILSVMLSFIVMPVSAEDTYIKSMSVTAILDENGDAHIKEVWDMFVYEGSEVYKVMSNMNNKRITNLKVRDDKNNQYVFIDEWNIDASREEKRNKSGLIQEKDRYELCFGIGDYGHRTYTFEYDVSNFVEQFEGDQGFNFAFFSELSLEIEEVLITLEYPGYSFTDSNSDIYAYGYEGYVDYSNGKIIMENDEGLESGSNKMQLLMRIDDNTFSDLSRTPKSFDDILEEAEEENRFPFEVIILFVALGIGFIVLIVVLVMNKTEEEVFEDGSEIDIDEDLVPLYKEIPCHNDLFRFYFIADKLFLIDEDIKGGLISAVILKWVRDGLITFEKVEATPGFFGKSEGFSVDLYDNLIIDNPLEEELFSYIRDASGMNMKFESGEFEKWCRNHYTLINDWYNSVEEAVEEQLKEEGLIREKDKIYKHFGKINDKYKEVVYTDALKEEMYQVIGFKKYLEELSMNIDKNTDIKTWENYLIYANILGLAEETERLIKTTIPHFTEHSYLNVYYHTHMIRRFSYKGVQAAHTASSSVSGGGGGGFSGGGGGGVR